jgi:hypothetical protein
MRILSTPLETETKSDVQNENKQVGTSVNIQSAVYRPYKVTVPESDFNLYC